MENLILWDNAIMHEFTMVSENMLAWTNVVTSSSTGVNKTVLLHIPLRMYVNCTTTILP